MAIYKEFAVKNFTVVSQSVVLRNNLNSFKSFKRRVIFYQSNSDNVSKHFHKIITKLYTVLIIFLV
jgi:hypothetical protein